MEYIIYLAFPLLCGIINRSRGHDDIDRGVFDLANFMTSYICFKDLYLSLVTMVGIRIWLTRGWYKYTMSHMGDLPHLLEMEEVKSIDWLTNKICGEPTDYASARNWGTVGMALRGFLMAIPLFVGLSWYLNNPYVSLLSIPMLLQGPIYRIVHDDFFGTVRVKRLINYGQAELITGGLYGTLISIAILCQ